MLGTIQWCQRCALVLLESENSKCPAVCNSGPQHTLLWSPKKLISVPPEPRVLGWLHVQPYTYSRGVEWEPQFSKGTQNCSLQHSWIWVLIMWQAGGKVAGSWAVEWKRPACTDYITRFSCIMVSWRQKDEKVNLNYPLQWWTRFEASRSHCKCSNKLKWDFSDSQFSRFQYCLLGYSSVSHASTKVSPFGIT